MNFLLLCFSAAAAGYMLPAITLFALNSNTKHLKVSVSISMVLKVLGNEYKIYL